RIADLLHLIIGELIRLDLHGRVAGRRQTRLGPGDGIVDDVLTLGRRGVGDLVDLELRTALEGDAKLKPAKRGTSRDRMTRAPAIVSHSFALPTKGIEVSPLWSRLPQAKNR